jgi:hypothetical protein
VWKEQCVVLVVVVAVCCRCLLSLSLSTLSTSSSSSWSSSSSFLLLLGVLGVACVCGARGWRGSEGGDRPIAYGGYERTEPSFERRCFKSRRLATLPYAIVALTDSTIDRTALPTHFSVPVIAPFHQSSPRLSFSRSRSHSLALSPSSPCSLTTVLRPAPCSRCHPLALRVLYSSFYFLLRQEHQKKFKKKG